MDGPPTNAKTLVSISLTLVSQTRREPATASSEHKKPGARHLSLHGPIAIVIRKNLGAMSMSMSWRHIDLSMEKEGKAAGQGSSG